MQYHQLVLDSKLYGDSLTTRQFRIGASTLLDDLLM